MVSSSSSTKTPKLVKSSIPPIVKVSDVDDIAFPTLSFKYKILLKDEEDNFEGLNFDPRERFCMLCQSRNGPNPHHDIYTVCLFCCECSHIFFYIHTVFPVIDSPIRV